jgi:hypothetical protein
MDRYLDLMALLREATGIDDVELKPRPGGDATVMLDAAIRTKSTQRLSLRHRPAALRSTPGQPN